MSVEPTTDSAVGPAGARASHATKPLEAMELVSRPAIAISPPVMASDLTGRKLQEARGIVVEDVALLLVGEKIS
jgi:hypothetical protein